MGHRALRLLGHRARGLGFQGLGAVGFALRHSVFWGGRLREFGRAVGPQRLGLGLVIATSGRLSQCHKKWCWDKNQLNFSPKPDNLNLNPKPENLNLNPKPENLTLNLNPKTSEDQNPQHPALRGIRRWDLPRGKNALSPNLTYKGLWFRVQGLGFKV